MKYIVYKRFKDKAIVGKVNLPVMTICEARDSVIMHQDKPICLTTSQNSYMHFARNDDGQGLFRGKLISSIQKKLSKKDSAFQNRWEKIWRDDRCRQYKRSEHTNYWLWNHDFFNAPIEDLIYIANLIGIKETNLK